MHSYEPMLIGGAISACSAAMLLRGFLKGEYVIRRDKVVAEESPIAFALLSALYVVGLVLGLWVLAGLDPDALFRFLAGRWRSEPT